MMCTKGTLKWFTPLIQRVYKLTKKCKNIKNKEIYYHIGDKLEQLLQNCQCDIHSRNLTLFVSLHQFINMSIIR